MTLQDLLNDHDSTERFHREIAESASRGGSREYQRYYKLQESRDGIVTHTHGVEVYVYEDSCFVIGDELDGEAYAVSQFDVHELVREILDKTPYVLTYFREEYMSDSQFETVFRGVYEE